MQQPFGYSQVPDFRPPPAAQTSSRMRVADTLGPAWQLMTRALFRPFDFGAWISFGLIFFLESLLEGESGNFNFNTNFPGGSGGGGGRPLPTLPDVDVMAAVLVAAAILLVALAIGCVALWLGTRGEMMAIRAVATGRADVSNAWRETKDAGYALLRFQAIVAAVGLVLFLPLAGAAVWVIYPLVQSGAPPGDWFAAAAAFGGLALLLSIPFAIVRGVTRHFLAPIMLKDGVSVGAAWTKFWRVGKDNVGGIVLFSLLHFVISLGAGIVGMVAGYLTCCVGFFPVLHHTVMAPWLVLERAWSLEVLASLGPEYDVITRDGPNTHYGPYGRQAWPAQWGQVPPPPMPPLG